jgi:hypothetical protein
LREFLRRQCLGTDEIHGKSHPHIRRTGTVHFPWSVEHVSADVSLGKRHKDTQGCRVPGKPEGADIPERLEIDLCLHVGDGQRRIRQNLAGRSADALPHKKLR